MNDDLDLDGRVALITGASAGIGAALARSLGRRGCKLVLCARRTERLESLAAELAALRVAALPVAADVTQDGDLERAVEAGRRAYGGIDIAVANAGFGVTGPLAELSLVDFRRQLETNLFGVLRTFHAAKDDLLARRGRFVAIGSASGYLATPGTGAYSASKFALRAFVDVLRPELRPRGVSVTHVIPGFIESEIRKVDNRGAYRQERKDPVPGFLIMKAADAAEEIADAVAACKAECVLTYHGALAKFIGQHLPWLVDAALRLSGRGWRDPGQGGA